MSAIAKRTYKAEINPDQMLLPLFSEIIKKAEIKQPEVAALANKPRRVGRPVKVQVDESEVVHWDDSQIEQIHLYLLDESFTVAGTSRTSSAVRHEIISWVLEKKAGSMPTPFSFEACCVFAGYDSQELRELFIAEMNLRGYMAA